MANPTLPTLTEGQATSLQNTSDDGLGVPYTRHLHDPSDTPPVETVMTQWQRLMATVLGGGPMGSTTNTPGAAKGLVFQHATALTIGAFACDYLYAGTDEKFPGGTLLLTASTTNYIYLDAAATLKTSTTAFPAGSFRLAKVTAGASSITAIEDRRFQNFDPSGATSWYNVAAAADVDMGGFDLKDIGQMDFGASTTLTIASGVITPTQVYHGVDTEAAQTTDALDTITADAAKVGQILLLWNFGGTVHMVTVKNGTGNLTLQDGQDYVMNSASGDSVICLLQDSATTWVELFRNAVMSPAAMSRNMNGTAFDLTVLGALSFMMTTNTIAAGVVTLTSDAQPSTSKTSFLRVTNEVGTTDDLDTITGGYSNQLLLLKPTNAPTDDLVVKHSVVVDGILLNDDQDFTMDDSRDYLLLFYDGTNWNELARSKFRYEDLASGSQRMSIPGFVSGALAAGVQKWTWTPHHAGKLNLFTCYVKTQPSGGSCIVNCNKNGSAIYSSDTNAVNIAASTSSDTSDQTSPVVAFAANDRIELEIKSTAGSPNGAADMTFTIDAEMDIK